MGGRDAYRVGHVFARGVTGPLEEARVIGSLKCRPAWCSLSCLTFPEVELVDSPVSFHKDGGSFRDDIRSRMGIFGNGSERLVQPFVLGSIEFDRCTVVVDLTLVDYCVNLRMLSESRVRCVDYRCSRWYLLNFFRIEEIRDRCTRTTTRIRSLVPPQPDYQRRTTQDFRAVIAEYTSLLEVFISSLF